MDRLALCLIYLSTGMLREDLEAWMTPEQKNDLELMKFVQEHKKEQRASRRQTNDKTQEGER